MSVKINAFPVFRVPTFQPRWQWSQIGLGKLYYQRWFWRKTFERRNEVVLLIGTRSLPGGRQLPGTRNVGQMSLKMMDPISNELNAISIDTRTARRVVSKCAAQAVRLRSVSTTRVHGPRTRVHFLTPVNSGRQLGPWTRAVNSGSGNRHLPIRSNA